MNTRQRLNCQHIPGIRSMFFLIQRDDIWNMRKVRVGQWLVRGCYVPHVGAKQRAKALARNPVGDAWPKGWRRWVPRAA